MSEEPFRILLVEDNPADAYLFRKALQSAGVQFELTVIEDGAEALTFARGEGKYAQSAAPDLAVLDLNLPKKEGREVLKAMRQRKQLSSVPVVIMSSSEPLEELAQMKEIGIERFITKPPDLEGFLQIGIVMREVLLKHSLRKG